MIFNMHLLLHLAKRVYYYGPSRAHSAFAELSKTNRIRKIVPELYYVWLEMHFDRRC